EKQDDDTEQGQVADQRGGGGQRLGGHARQRGQQQAQTGSPGQQVGQHHRIMQPQALHQGHRQQADEAGDGGGQQYRQEHQRRVIGALLGAVHEDGHRQQCQRRAVEHQEQDLGVGGGVLLRIELLQRVHGLDAYGRGGIVQAEDIGGEV